MRESRETVVDGIGVKVTQLPAKRARNLLRRLMATAGPAIAKALAGKEVDLASLSDASLLLFDRLPESELDAIYSTLLEECTLSVGTQGSPDFKIGTHAQIGDELLAGKILTEGKIVWFALEVNFGDFLGAAKNANLAGLLGKELKSPSQTA